MIKPKRTAEEYEQSKLGGGKSGNSNSGGSSGLITPKRTASEFEGYKRGDDAWYSSDEQIRPSTGRGNGSSRLAEAARLKAEGDARKVGRLYSIYSRRLKDASAAAQASSARQRYDYYAQQYQALQEQKTGATALAGIGARDLDGKGSEKLKKLKEQRDKWAGYVRQIEAGKSPEIESTPYADWMYAINTDQYGKAAAQGQAQLTQEAIDRRGNYTRNELEAMRDREAAQGNDIMVKAYDEALSAKADDTKLGVVEAIRRTQGYKDYTSPRTRGKAVKVDGLTVDSDLYMTPTERKTYDYLFDNGAKFGISAGEYYSLLRPTLERRQAQIQERKNRQMVESGVVGAVAANVGSVGANLLSGTGYLAGLVDALGGGEVTTDKPYFAMGRMADTVRDETRQQITDGVGGGFGGDAAAFAYDTGMSIADFIASYYATGGGVAGKISEAAMLTIMGTRAAESTTRDSLERGATQEQALLNGTAAGIAEVLFEKLSIENFESIKSLLTSSSYIKRVLSQAGVEASEEMCTEIANILTDRAIMGDKSEYETAVKQYRAQGMTLAEAEAQANLDMAKRVGLSGLGGFISGGTTGSFAVAMSAGEQSKLGKYVLNNDAALFDTLSYARFRGAEQAGQIATDLAEGNITFDDARKAYKGKTRDLGGIFAQMVGEAYETQVARGMTPNAQLGTNPTADDIIAYSNAMFAERANAPIETETETESQPQEQTQPDRLMLAAQQAAQGQTESVPADLESAARQSVERQEAQRQERRAAQIRQTQEQRAAVREGIRTQLDGAVSAAAADTASAAYDGISDVGAYIRTTYAIDNAARAGQSLDSIGSNIAAAIPEQTRTAIYNAAVSAYKAQNSVGEEMPAKTGTTAETSAQNATEGKTEAKANTVAATEAQTVAEGQETSYTHDASTRGGLVYAEGVTPKSKAEANAAKALDIALKAVGITVNVKGDNGVDVVLSDGTVKKGAAYGLYNKGNGEISTEGISLVTILHESVHKIGNEVSTEDWTAFKDAVISAARDAGVDVDAQRQSLEDAYSGIEDSAQAIDEEQIAYIVGQLADKPDLAEHFAARFIHDEQTQSLFKRLIDKVKELLGRIRDALTRRKYYKASEAIATDIDALDKVESAYFDALEKAGKSNTQRTDYKRENQKTFSEVRRERNRETGELSKRSMDSSQTMQERGGSSSEDGGEVSGVRVKYEMKDESEQLTPYEIEYKINGIRKEISELDNESMFASEIKQRSINNKIYKLEEDLSKLVEIERKATKRTPLNVVLDNLSKYRYTDLESIAEQLTDNAWDYDEDISRSELEDGIRQIIEDRAAEMSPIEMQAPKYGVWVRPISDLTQSNSTQFELKDPDDAAYRKLERKNTQLEKKVAALKQELKRTNGMVVKSGEARRVAAKIVKDYSSSYDKQTLEENLQKTFDFFAAKQEDGKTGLEHFEEAMPQIRAMAEDIINRSSEPIAELEEFYKPIRDMIRKTKITPTEQQKAEIADWGKFVRENRGKITIAKEGGASVLSLYENLVEADPDYFESDIPEGDMLPAIAEYVNNTAAPTYVNPFDEFMDEAVDGLAHEIVGEYLVAPKLKTFADKKFEEKQAALKKQGERLKAQTDKVRETYKQKLKDQRQTASDKLKEKTGEIRTAYKQKLADQRANAATAKKALREDLKERQKRKAIKSRIAQRLSKLNKWLKSPEKRAYVPQHLIKSATEAAQFVSEKLSRADYYDSRIPVLEEKIKSAKSAEQKLKYGEYLAKIRKQGDSARDKLNALINSYDEIITQMKQDEQDTTVKESVVESIKNAREYLGDTAVNKMSSDQLKALEDVLKLVMSDIDHARKEFSGEKAKEAFALGKRIADNLSEVQNKGDIAIAAKTLNGDRFLRRLGGYAKDNPFDALADKWTDGTRRKIATERDLTGLFDDLVNDKAKMKQLKAMRDEKNAVELTINGEKISLTHAEMINLYGQLNSEDTLRHIIYGGETLRRDTKGQKTGRNRRIMPAKIDFGVRAAIEKNSELSGYDKEVLLNELDNEVMAQYEQLKRDIESKMTDYDRAWYKTIREMFDSVSPALIDEQNLNEFGFRKATQPNYWRIETDKNFVRSEEAWSTLKYDANPANMGFMKKRVRGKNTIVLRDVTEFVDSYIRDTSTYVGMLAPSLYTKRVLSAQDPDRAWSVREALEVYGKTALGTINELMDDNIGLKANTGSMLMNRLRGGLAQSSLMINPAVSVGQAASFFPAYPYLSAKELAKGLFVKPSSIPEKIMVKYSPYYWTRTKGYSLQQYADVGKDKMSEVTQRGKAVLGWITGMDLFTVRRLWMAAEEQVKSERPDLKIGTKEQIENGESPFYKEVAKSYEEMLIRTQPVYAAQQRTGLARSKNEILRSFSMFRTVRDQNFGEVYEAIGRLHRYTQDAKTGAHGTTKEDVKAARKHLAKVIIGQLLSALMLVGLKEIAKLLLDHNADDFKDEYGEIDLGAAAGSLGINFLESLASNVLFGSDIYSLVKSMIDGSTYYGIDVNVTGIANDFLNSVRNITQNFNGTTVYNLAVSVSQILGVPLRNTVKMIEGAAESINDIANGLAGTYASEFDRKNFRMTLDGITPSRLYKAIKDGDSARADKYREVLMGMVNDKGEKKYTTSDIDRAVAKLLAADDDRIKEAYEAKKSKDTETVEKLRGEIVADGFTVDMFNTAINAYENSLKLEDDEEATEEDKVLETSSYSTTELCDAILDGDKDAENGMIDVLKKEGKTGEQIETNVKNDLKDRYQELYRTEGEKAAVELGKQIISKAGERYELTNYTLNRWAAVVEACDNEDIAAANRKISLIKDKSELGYLKTTLSGYYKREYEVAINTEDKERQKELEKQMRNINLYDATTGERYFSSEKLSEWRKEFNF